MRTRNLDAAVLGATGMVGRQFLRLLAEHPWFSLRTVVASERSRGQRLRDRIGARGLPTAIGDIELSGLDELVAAPPPVVFCALPAKMAGPIEEELARRGVHVFSNSAAHRHDSDVPLLIPEVNAPHLQAIATQRRRRGWSGSLVTNPNCSTVGLSLGMHPWVTRFPVERIHVASYQAMSGAGYDGLSALAIQGNVIPHIVSEEEKMARESRKILGKWDGDHVQGWTTPVHASCVRVPVMHGHLLAVHVEFGIEVSEEQLTAAIQGYVPAYGALELPTAPAAAVELMDEADAPQPARDLDDMAVRVGRIRCQGRLARAFLLSHNLVRGSAGGSLLNAELACAQGELS